MKFCLDKVVNGSRLGQIKFVCGGQEQEVVTPMCMLYTKSGSAPMLSKDMLHRIKHLPAVTHYPLPLLAEISEAVSFYGKGIKRFTALDGFLAYISIQDPAVTVQSGYNDKHGTAIWGRGGKQKLDVELFMQVQEAFQPDFYQALCDADTNNQSTRKRAKKSLERTLSFLDKIIEQHEKSQKLSNTVIFGSVVGGYSEEERIKSAVETSKRPVAGFTIEGFHQYGPQTEHFSVSSIKDLLHKTMEILPEDKPRLMHSVWRPDQVLEAVSLGIDMFDSSYPYLVTERGCALTFEYDIKRNCDSKNADSTVGNKEENESSNARSDTDVEINSELQNSMFDINLNEKEYADDFGPLLTDCECYTCRHFSRSYISHLLNTSELLAGTLLIMHNFHHYMQFFTAVQDSIRNENIELLKSVIANNRK